MTEVAEGSPCAPPATATASSTVSPRVVSGNTPSAPTPPCTVKVSVALRTMLTEAKGFTASPRSRSVTMRCAAAVVRPATSSVPAKGSEIVPSGETT